MTLDAIADSIKTLAVLAGVIVISYSGFMLMTSKESIQREQWKEIILAVVIGLCIVFLAPLVASTLSGGKYCG
ncbi:TrbC/VirB2 family protein [Candidatus Micrarchaeota archaeon]|nr:TrbC/VirB2 family protein [Candidatus Micrarchaeota archaeon]